MFYIYREKDVYIYIYISIYEYINISKVLQIKKDERLQTPRIQNFRPAKGGPYK